MSESRRFPYLFELIAILGLILYVVQSWYFVQSLDSIGDEGSYLYKGYMFARGDYYPFQEYTFWTNKAPLAFLIPGYIQLWFGPGLREARYFAMLVSVLMVIGVWVTARRLAGKAWAALAVWVVALSLAQISVYSEAVSQGLVACMLAWMFVLTLGENRPLWQLVLGSALAVLIVMTRQNMAVVPALLVGYIFWQYGARAGWWAFGTSAVLLIAFHLFYWPGILQIWAPWLPRSLTPFLNDFRVAAQLTQTNFVFDASPLSRLQSFATGMHDHFFIFLGSVSALILWPKRDAWKSSAQCKMAVFLGVTFFVLFLMHAWASLPTNNCVHCFSGYQTFYSSAGLFFIIVVFSNGVYYSKSRLFLLIITLLFFAATLGLYYYQNWGDWLLETVQVPRLNRLLRQGEFGTVPLGEIFTHTFGLSLDLQRRIASVVGGLFSGLALILLAWAFHRFALQTEWKKRYSLASVALACCLFVGTLFPVVRDKRPGEESCSTNFLTYYEEAGRSFADLLPPGSALYWKGSGRHLAFMLYVDNVKLFLPQIHAGGGYVTGDTQQLLKLGRYNEELDAQWRQSADVLVIWETYLTREFRDFLDQPAYERVPFDMGNLAQCEDVLLVYRKIS
ncbi:MAG TPA: glycosyltransferase family 39 protein [Anaerolineales bacterium]|nr:glycosyltransferase family 39 protein [Anaerolineales bacterium]